MKSDPIYLDYQATTPLDPKVREAMLPYLCECFGILIPSTILMAGPPPGQLPQLARRLPLCLGPAMMR